LEHPALPEINQKIKLNSFGKKDQAFLLNDTLISLGDTQIKLAEITHFKFGVAVLQMGMFVVGRKYQMHIKTPTTRFNLYFDLLFHKIVNGVWLRIGDRLLAEMIQAVKAGTTLKLSHCKISKTGITLHRNAGRAQKEFFITWDDLHYEKKYNRLVLNSKAQPRRWVNLYYLDNWNVDILMDFLDWVYKENGLEL
jgi:hypothetical protein